MTGFPVVVRAGRDYLSPPLSGTSLAAVDVLTNPARWQAAGFGYDSTQPAPVAVAQGMALTWATDPDQPALWGVWFDATAGQTYTLSATVRAATGSARWRASVGWSASSGWAEPDNYDQTRTVSWTAPETRAFLFGVETFGPNSSTHVVTAIGVWDHDDPSVQWKPFDLDKCKVALPVEVKHGRSTIDSQPDAPVCTFAYLGANAPTALGDSIEVEVAGAPGSTWTDPDVLWTDSAVSWLGTRGRSLRFRGFVTDVRAVEIEGNVELWEITATGEQANLGRVPITITRPAETDVARVQAIAAAAGVSIDIIGTPGPTLLADTIERDALDALHEVCASSGGMVWQQRDGTITYGTMHRGEVMPEWRVGCQFIADGIAWQHDTDKVANHVVVKYGSNSGDEWTVRHEEAHGTAVVSQDTFRDDASIAKWGYRHLEVSSKCAATADAAMLGAAILARRKQPRWVMPGVVLLKEKSTEAEWAQVAVLDVGHTALLDVETVPTPTPGSLTAWTVEGWVETWESAGRRIQLALSEHRLGRSIPWSEADDQTWAYWRDNASWLDAMVEA